MLINLFNGKCHTWCVYTSIIKYIENSDNFIKNINTFIKKSNTFVSAVSTLNYKEMTDST